MTTNAVALERRFTLTADKASLLIVRAGKQALEHEGSSGMAQAMLASAQEAPAGLAVEPYSFAHVLALAGLARSRAAPQ